MTAALPSQNKLTALLQGIQLNREMTVNFLMHAVWLNTLRAADVTD